MSQESIEKMIYDETERRLAIMESPEYEFPKRINRTDIIAISLLCIICLLLIVLCMMGVIS